MEAPTLQSLCSYLRLGIGFGGSSEWALHGKNQGGVHSGGLTADGAVGHHCIYSKYTPVRPEKQEFAESGLFSVKAPGLSGEISDGLMNR